MQNELVHLLLRVFGTTAALMAVIMLVCIATPHLAKLIDKWLEKHRSESRSDDAAPDAPEVRGVYDASSDEGYDLNFKIYNKDIYGVDFKHGKKRQEQDGRSDNSDGRGLR